MINSEKRAWLPHCQKEELEVAHKISNYADQPTSYFIDPILKFLGISKEDIEELKNVNGYLPNLYSIAILTCKLRRKSEAETTTIIEFFWVDQLQNLWKELRIVDEMTGKCEIHLEKLG